MCFCPKTKFVCHNIAADAGKRSAADTRIVGVFSCSASVMATEQENNAAVLTTEQPLVAGGTELLPQEAVPAAAEPVVEPAATEPVVEPAAAEPVAEPAQPDEADVPQADDEMSVAASMQAAMQNAMQRMEEMKARLDEGDKQRESDIKKRADEVKVEEEAKTKQQAEIVELRAALRQRKEKELQTAKKQRDDTFNRLTETLSTLECDLEKRKPKATDTKGQLLFETDVAEAAIKRLVTASDQAHVMHSENNQLKRQHKNIEENLCNFEGGRVEASASAAAKRQHIQPPNTDSFLVWKRQNPNALKWQVDAQLKKSEDAKRGTVRVNASYLKWHEAAETPQSVSSRPITSSIYTSYPEIASELMSLNTGKLISGEETVQLMQTTPDNTQVARNQPWM